MPTPKLSHERSKQIVETVEQCLREGKAPRGVMAPNGERAAIYEALMRLGLAPGSGTTITRAEGIYRPIDWSIYQAPPMRPQASYSLPRPFSVPELPDEDADIDDLLARRDRAFQRKAAHKEARRLVPVEVKIDGPIGILHMGDPHLDDDGCDWPRLREHIALVQNTEGLLAGNAGDFTNNWIGRLARLYAHQETTAKQAWKLAEWFVRQVPWLYLVGGNHDLWSGDGDPVQWMSRQAGVVYEPHGVRLGLNFPNGRQIRINARHDFKGHSQWNPAHGPGKAAMLGPPDHIFLSGHRHVFGLGWHKQPDGVWSCALRIGTYKVFDGFADAQGFPEHNIPAVVTIINPYAASEEGLVEVIKDPAAGADYLAWARQKFADGKSIKK